MITDSGSCRETQVRESAGRGATELGISRYADGCLLCEGSAQPPIKRDAVHDARGRRCGCYGTEHFSGFALGVMLMAGADDAGYL